jgi:hypothetical protein
MFLQVPNNTDSSRNRRLNVTLGGRFQGTVLRGHVGNLADLRIYASGLSQGEVQAIMAGGGLGTDNFRIISIDFDRELGEATLTWTSRPGEVFAVDSSTDLQQSPWFEITDNVPAEADSTTTSFTATGISPSAPRLFFQIRK